MKSKEKSKRERERPTQGVADACNNIDSTSRASGRGSPESTDELPLCARYVRSRTDSENTKEKSTV